MSKNNERNQSVATPPDQTKQSESKEPAVASVEAAPTVVEMHAESHKVEGGIFVDAQGVALLFKDGKPIPQDQVFMAQSVRQEGYWKAGRQFNVIPSEVAFKSLSAQQQRALLDAKDTVLVVTRKS